MSRRAEAEYDEYSHHQKHSRYDEYSHHEQHSRYDEARVGRVAEEGSHEGREVQVYSLHDHVKHFGLPTAEKYPDNQTIVRVCVCLLQYTSAKHEPYLKN